MTDIWTPGPPPTPAPPITGLPPTDTWIAAEPCATDSSGGLTSIIDNITITGAPGAITSVANDQPIWSIVLNDGTATSNFRIDRYQGGVLTDSPVIVANASGAVTFADPVMLAADPTQPLQAATKHYVDSVSGSSLTEAPSDGQWYARQNAAWTPSAGSVAGRTGAVVLTHTDITDWTATLAPYALTTSVPAASTAFPVMDGTAAVGIALTWARGDHIHPTDTSRYAASNPSGYQTAAQVTAALPVASSTTPLMDGTAAIGSAATFAKADHVHPSDTSKLPLSGGTLTGALTPSQTAGIVGTTTNNNAAAGSVGEVISANITTGVPLTTGVAINVTSISLTAGDWDVSGEVWLAAGTGGATAALAAINTVSATLPTTSSLATAMAGGLFTVGASYPFVLPLRSCRVSLNATTTYYLIGQLNFTTGACTATGNIIARRVR